MRLTPLAVGMAIGLGAYCLGREVIRRQRWFDYAGKVVIVTGGSRGLGLVLARQSRIDEAIEQFRIAVKLKPDYVEAQSDLKILLQARDGLEKRPPGIGAVIRPE